MDVILDSNMMLEDPIFERAQFRELIAYLRRTNSRMVIPVIVRDEVEARFRERLSHYVEKARGAWEHVRKLSGGSHYDLPSVDVNGAVNSLRARMQHPSRDVPESIFPQLRAIDFDEVVRRAIERRRPASAEGEELRDVIGWLHVKRYASEKDSEIAFVTRDLGFRISRDEQALHPDLAAEVANAGLSISFHPDIGSFLRTHSLTEHSITEAWLSQFLPIPDLRRVATSMLLVKAGAYGIVEQAEIDSLELSKGTEYEVAPNSSYVEAAYKGSGTLRIAPNVFTLNFAGVKENTLTYQAIEPSLDEGVNYSLLLRQPPHSSFGLNLRNSFINTPNTISTQPAVPENRKCFFTLAVSGRVEDGKMVSGHIDDLQINHTSSLVFTG
jgi:hypothetical protein